MPAAEPEVLPAEAQVASLAEVRVALLAEAQAA
jgi:hypothetical protein